MDAIEGLSLDVGRRKIIYERFRCPIDQSLQLSSSGITVPASGWGWVWEQLDMTVWVWSVGHMVSLRWQSSLYICLLSRGISCWPKLKGCPNARHLQYYRMVKENWGEQNYRTARTREYQHICNNTFTHTTYQQVSVSIAQSIHYQKCWTCLWANKTTESL